MMKFHSAITGGLAAFLIVPLFAQEKALRTLENALLGTDRAIDSLQSLQKRITQEPLAGIDLIIAATEPSILDERERDARLETLRNEVNSLQMQFDSLMHIQNPGAMPPPDGRVPTTGMDDSVRRALEQLGKPDRGPGERKSTNPNHTPQVLPDGPNYSADPVAQARAYYKLGRYQDGLTTLRNSGNAPIALYWKARCLEKLGRVEDSIAELEKVVELSPDSAEGKRAKTDIEFLSWKVKRKQPKAGGKE